ncbi:MAG: DUF3990 domain-containing protein [Bacteroidales bacterium]|nr:DUF3990 domain-containing protein [Bacteroidales bacterium]
MLDNALFHGSDHIVETPWPGGGKIHNDYGPGFYCTENLELAREWSCSDAPSAFVNHYAFEPAATLKIAHLDGPEYHVLNWLALLLKNRQFSIKHTLPQLARDYVLQEFYPSLDGYDIICGYRADDSYFSIAADFLEGSLSLTQLKLALQLGHLGHQVFLQSPRAFDALVFLSAEIVDRDIYLLRRQQRDIRAREAFRHMKADQEGVLMIDILRNKWRNDDERLR